MKCFLLAALLFSMWTDSISQSYPDPEFTNEVYWYSGDSANKLVRLEKFISKMDTKTKMGGFGGAESGYNIDGIRSPVRLQGGHGLTFIISKNSTMMTQSPQMDSMMRANGIDPAMRRSIEEMQEPSRTITLYKTEQAKEQRKITMQKTPGAMPFGSKKIKSSDKYSFSVKKVREGYYVLVIDKSLPPGEYAFIARDAGSTGIDGSVPLFAFGID